MEPEDKKEMKTIPMDVSLEVEDMLEPDPKPMEASTKRIDEKEDSGESVTVSWEDLENPKVPAVDVVPSLAVEQESKDEFVPAIGDIKSLPAEAEEKAEIMVNPSTVTHSVEKESHDTETRAEASNKLPTAKNKAVGSLKARAMITKKFPVTYSIKRKVRPSDSKSRRSTGMKKKSLLSNKDEVSKDEQGIEESTSDDKNLPGNLSEVRPLKEKEILVGEKGGKSRPNSNGKQATGQPTIGDKENQSNRVVKEVHKRIKSKNKQKFGPGSKNKKRKLEEGEKFQSSERGNNSVKNGKVNNSEENAQENGNKKEKLGGLIFMCSSKTKPDCLKYHVMGVNMGKKDLVMAIQPGLKLFLYDYDLKLMYGIFKASSSGGIKLEPRAFNGSFPIQVRFSVQCECHPLPEVVFKKAIFENFTSKHKFRTELSHKQVRMLSKLFQPMAVGVDPPPQAEEAPVRPSQRKRIRAENPEARERASRHQRRSKRSGHDRYSDRDARRHKVRVSERDHRDSSPLRRVEAPREMFLTEREYPAYGLQGERRNLTITASIDPRFSSREAYYERDHLAGRTDEVRWDTVLGHRDYSLVSKRYLDDIDYRTYSRDTRPELSPAAAGRSVSSAYHFYPEDQYISYRRGPASLVPYAEHLRREDIPSSSLHGYVRAEAYSYETDRIRRLENIPAGSRIIYTADAHAEYDQPIRYHVAPADAAYMPISSRYSFAGSRI